MHAADAHWPVEPIETLNALRVAIDRVGRSPDAGGGPVAWRGLPRVEWTLRSTLDRLFCEAAGSDDYTAYIARERSILNEFRLRALPFASDLERNYLQSIDDEAVWNVMALGRHSGLPSRVIDWTASPMVATYFACMEHADSDGVIWWFDQTQLDLILDRRWDSWQVPTRATVYGLANLNPAQQKALRLNERCLLMAAFDEHCVPWVTKLHYPFAFPRMEAQQGFVTMCGRVRVDHNTAIDKLPDGHGIRRGRLVISGRVKGEVMRWLHECNVNARSLLYPGVDIAARAIAARLDDGDVIAELKR